MTDAAYVFGGWALTGGVFVVYTARLWQRTRRASKLQVEVGEPRR
jgi:hypothetical protein